MVCDSSWEYLEARTINDHPLVVSFAKNDHLGFVVIYSYQGVTRKYYSDFIIKLRNGEFLVLETKGQDDERNRTKREFLDLWNRAVSFEPNNVETSGIRQ